MFIAIISGVYFDISFNFIRFFSYLRRKEIVAAAGDGGGGLAREQNYSFTHS